MLPPGRNHRPDLYNVLTGEQCTGFLQVYPGGLASFSTGDGRYELRDMTTEDRGLIAAFDEQPSQYFPGYVVTWHERRGSRLRTL